MAWPHGPLGGGFGCPVQEQPNRRGTRPAKAATRVRMAGVAWAPGARPAPPDLGRPLPRLKHGGREAHHEMGAEERMPPEPAKAFAARLHLAPDRGIHRRRPAAYLA